MQEEPARWVAWEEREGVRVRVVYEPASGKIVIYLFLLVEKYVIPLMEGY